jgi:nitroimidazol reductase NimA-like FMN-containing flavoprotein (pyridoxamine 5'-phosphate oxidase superfamily)
MAGLDTRRHPGGTRLRTPRLRGGTPVKIVSLSGDECRELLVTKDVGRLAVVVGGYPEVFPVNYAVVRDRVVVRTDAGVKLRHARFERVCFQVDELDTAQRTGWSVLVKGIVHELKAGDRHAEELDFVAAQIRPWAGAAKSHVLVVTPMNVTGRRIVGA